MPAQLENWTARRAANFARVRIDRIKLALMEIAVVYDDVDSSIGWSCDEVRDHIDHAETGLLARISEAEAEGRSR
ncbi:hypothetical protein [Paradevosia shaoguanensis]|uniref:Uncharacterized protein n=1 Tax=Paradevosia shaoguanensis TaxID=1335043 RepID=A0AA41QRA9_9HYPH|nr:hypothetical protein [Paradevosia shaoguanensis]MCF1744645.1 hypothetical protein [Paradevosia shaoguanensis]MCI0129128.1 hypothetical protein [Paradevosia shaoguanensis]